MVNLGTPSTASTSSTIIATRVTPRHELGRPVQAPPSSIPTGTPLPLVSQLFESNQEHHYCATTFILSVDETERNKQLEAIKLLEKRFTPDQLSNHSFEWIQTGKRDEWLPRYSYYKYGNGKTPTIDDIWNEYQFGMDGCLSIRQLQAGWEARWKRNNGSVKTESSRRGKIIKILQLLAAKSNWTADLALRFLTLRFPIPSPSCSYLRSTRAFMDYLRDGIIMEIVESAVPPTSS